MQRIAKGIRWISAVGIACALLVGSFGCSELGKRYVTVDVDSEPTGAKVEALISSGLSGDTFSPGALGTTPTGKRTMHFAFGAPGAGGTKIGIRVHKPGYKDYEVFFTRDECYPSREEAVRNVKHIFAKLTPQTEVPQETTKSEASYRKVELTSYVLEVPLNWEVGGRAEEQNMREMLSIYPRYKITALSTFGVPEGAVVTVYELTLPIGEGADYIEKLFDLNDEKFRAGRNSGLVKEVVENKKTKQGSFDALLVDWESTRGGLPHSRQWVLHTGQAGDNIAVIVVFCDNRSYKLAQEAVDRIAKMMRIKEGGNYVK